MNMDAMRYRERQAIFGVYVCVLSAFQRIIPLVMLVLLAGNRSQTAAAVLQ